MPGPLLCAVDLTDLSVCAARFASALARITGVSVTLLHAREPGEREADAGLLTALAGRLIEGGVDARTEIVAGDPAAVVLHRAETLRASAIVMGTHGGRGVERMMLGSVAETVLHRAGRPVATLRGPEHADGPLRRIVCGADLEDAAPLRYASDLARRAAAELVVVHAVRDLPEEGGRGLVPASYGPILIEEARRGLDRALALVDAAPGRVLARVVPGSPSRALLLAAEDESADLLVVGIHSHVVGSTTHPIVRGAPCPVLTVPPGGGGKEIA